MTDDPSTAICWLRRDLRLHDNPALLTAAEQAERVVPLFVIDPVLETAADLAPRRLAFLYDALRSLGADLEARGSRLVVRHGHPATEVAALARSLDAVAVFAEEDWWPYARRRDAEVGTAVRLHLCPGLTVHHPSTLAKPDGRPYTVFTAFRRAWLARPLPPARMDGPAAERLGAALAARAARTSKDAELVPSRPTMSEGPEREAHAAFPASEAEALARLRRFAALEGLAAATAGAAAGEHGRQPQHQPGDVRPPIVQYAAWRDRLDVRATSELSPYLRFGMLSPRLAVAAANRAAQLAGDARERSSALRWLDELIWREFYQYILYWFPRVLEDSFRKDLAEVAWSTDEQMYAAWCDGQTGYPVVDAAVRTLVETGWLHNRARMIVASFLTKDLLVDWRRGEHFFMRHLLDGDPAANNGGWQWTAGTGADAAPYFRIFNPVLQGRRCDPHGDYVRTWLPELRPVPNDYVHAPWQMPTGLQQQVGCVIGRDYPAPVVQHEEARRRALEAYRRARSLSPGTEGRRAKTA